MPDKLTSRRIPYFGDFVLFDEIGRGGMGVVYNAQQTKLDRPVALKVLHSGMAAGSAGMQRLRIEAEAVAKLDHPNIVPIYEFGEHEGHPYLAMQLIKGESLAEYITRKGMSLNERDAARLLAKIARAVHHAHQRGVLHRDLKPGNILLDESSEPHLIDFGLAKCLEQDSGMTQTGAFMGTPAYASPEQAAGQNKSITTATDIYSLGAIFYTLLAGQPPFAGESAAAIIEQVKNNPPRSLRSVRPQLHRDMEVICQKCLEKSPEQRYESALTLAEDLERFLDGSPIAARPVRTLERFGMWVKRHPVHAGLWTTGSLLVLVTLTGLLYWRDSRGREIEARNHIQRQQLLDEIQRARLTERSPGWVARAWPQAVQAALIPTAVKSDEVRNQAAALLAGLDARRGQYFTNFGAASVRFDQQGTRLLMGGMGDGAKLWDSPTAKLHTASGTNGGAVAFLENGSAVQLLLDVEPASLVLADVVTSQVVSTWNLPELMTADVRRKEALRHEVLTPDGSTCILVLANQAGGETIVALTATEVRTMANSAGVTAVAVSADGSLVAIAESTGRVCVWQTRDGKRMAEFQAGRNEICSLALHQTVRLPESSRTGTNGVWLVAVGDSGGVITLWDLRTQTVSTYCHGSEHRVFAIAFSPDGMTMASGGRGPVKVWDVATGRHLLTLNTGDFITGLDFSPDGLRLAVSSQGQPGYPANVSIWELEFDRGIQTLRGLSGQISKIAFSSDGRWLAALSHNWEIGLWDLPNHRLLRVFETPKGDFADNAALAFSTDGQRLAFSASKSARIWDVTSGSLMNVWPLPPGLVDRFGVFDDEHLLLFRVETADATLPPDSRAPRENHPRVCRIRDLLQAEALKPVGEILDFNWHIFRAQPVNDRRSFVAEGIRDQGGRREILFKCFDGFTGKELWGIPSSRNGQSNLLVPDATGKLVALRPDQSPNAMLIEAASGAGRKRLEFSPLAFSVTPPLYAVGELGRSLGITLLDGNIASPLVTLGIDQSAPAIVCFDRTGAQLAWGNADGTITVCQLKKIHDRLKSADLAW